MVLAGPMGHLRRRVVLLLLLRRSLRRRGRRAHSFPVRPPRGVRVVDRRGRGVAGASAVPASTARDLHARAR